MVYSKRLLKVIWLVLIVGLASCTYEVLPEENACDAIPQLELVLSEDTECGSSTGKIQVETGDEPTAPLKFSINGQDQNVTGLFGNLSASTYKIEVETIDGCTNTLDVEIKNLSGLNIQVEASVADCGVSNGNVIITPEGGEAPYQYKLNDGVFQPENAFNNLAAGNYTVVAEDAVGCNVVQNIDVTANVSFSSIQAIIQANCVNSSCHGGNVSPDFRQASNITASAGRVKSRTQAKTMPPSSSGNSLTAQEIELIACWVDGGAKQ